jgi:F-box-like
MLPHAGPSNSNARNRRRRSRVAAVSSPVIDLDNQSSSVHATPSHSHPPSQSFLSSSLTSNPLHVAVTPEGVTGRSTSQPFIPSTTSHSLVSASNAPQPVHPFPSHILHQKYTELIASVQHSLTKDWVPRPLTPREVDEDRLECARRLATIHGLEAMLRRISPTRNPQAEQTLLMSRIEYRFRFWRTFRLNDLPTEIITNIFRYVAWSSTNANAGVKGRLWLTWTCKHWRTIALEDPTLWNAIWFRDLPPFERSLAWFDRAGVAPLDIRINDQDVYHFNDKDMETLLTKLFSKISNIRILIVVVRDWEPVLAVLDRLRSASCSGVPLAIERFELHRTGSPYIQLGEGYQPSSFLLPIALFGSTQAALLRYLSLNGVHIDWRNSPLTNLTTIDIRRIPLERSPGILEFRDLLRNSPALQKLCMDGAGPQWQAEEGAHGLEAIELLELKVLIISDFSLHYASYVLSHISAPNVRDLTLMNLVGEDYTPLVEQITTRFTDVRLLTVYSVELLDSAQSNRTLVKWLESMPRLTYLRIAQVKQVFLDAFLRDPYTFELVTDQASSPGQCLCPNVSILECQAVDPKVIYSWGVRRRDRGVPLKKIYITRDIANKITPEDQKLLSTLAGLFVLEFGGKALEEDEILK